MNVDIREYLYAKVYVAVIVNCNSNSFAKTMAEQAVKDFDNSGEKLDLY